MSAIIVLIILVVIAVVVVNLYNRLAQLRLRCDSAWSDIDVQLKRRQDLIPELLDAVKGHAPQEQAMLDAIRGLHVQAVQSIAPAARAAAEMQITAAVEGVMAVVETHPELKSSEQFKALHMSLNLAESSLQGAQRYYNSVASDWNARVRSFPSNMVAGVFGFAQRQLFQADRSAPPSRCFPSEPVPQQDR